MVVDNLGRATVEVFLKEIAGSFPIRGYTV
jgi:hypothetical protein